MQILEDLYIYHQNYHDAKNVSGLTCIMTLYSAMIKSVFSLQHLDIFHFFVEIFRVRPLCEPKCIQCLSHGDENFQRHIILL